MIYAQGDDLFDELLIASESSNNAIYFTYNMQSYYRFHDGEDTYFALIPKVTAEDSFGRKMKHWFSWGYAPDIEAM